MDVSIIYTVDARVALADAIGDHQRFSLVADIARCLETVSDALVNGHEFSEPSEVMAVEIWIGGVFRQLWIQVSSVKLGGLQIVVPNPNWAGGLVALLGQVSDNRKVWRIGDVELCGRPLGDR